MQLFFTQNIQNNIAIIDGQEHIHLAKALRKVIGDVVHLLDGKGALFLAEITGQTKKVTTLYIKEVVESVTANPNNLILAVAPTKNLDRYEWMVEKATEIGVKEIIPFFSQNSERRRLKTERVEAIAISAVKQSKTLFVPKIWEPIKFKELFIHDIAPQKYIAYLRENTENVVTAFPQLNIHENTIVLIGPEGGFTVEEAQLAEKNNFKTLSLGNKRLRTETAGVFTASAYQLLCK